MYELPLGMKILIQRGSKPFIQRENSVLKIRQHINLCWITNQDPLQGTGKSAQGYEAAWMGGEFGGGRIHVCVWLSPFMSARHCHSLLIDCTPVQKKRF